MNRILGKVSVFSIFHCLLRMWEANVRPLDDPFDVNHCGALVSVLYTKGVSYSDKIIIYRF